MRFWRFEEFRGTAEKSNEDRHAEASCDDGDLTAVPSPAASL